MTQKDVCNSVKQSDVAYVACASCDMKRHLMDGCWNVLTVWCFDCDLVVAGRYFERVELWWVQRFLRDAKKFRQLDCSWWRFGPCSRQKEKLHCAQIDLDQSEIHEQVFQAFTWGTEGVDVVDIDENSAMDNSSCPVLHPPSLGPRFHGRFEEINLIQWPRTLTGVTRCFCSFLLVSAL